MKLPRVLGIEELTIRTGPVWRFDQLPLAHQAMNEDLANGKMVVVVS